MKKPAYKRGPYQKHDAEVEMAEIRTDRAVALLTEIVQSAVEASPLVRLPKYNIKQGSGDEEEAVLLLSDLQVGNKTPSTNMKIIAERMEKLAQGVLKITTLQRHSITIKKLNIFLLGDMIQSEDIQTKVDLDALECVLMDQIFLGAVPMVEKLLLSLVSCFPGGIDVWCVPGNHGSLGRLNAVTTNWDTMIYKILEAKTQNYGDIRWHIEEKTFYQQVDVMGKRFLISHGDCIPRYLNIPIYGITQRAMRWQGSLGEFDYLCLGHFQTPIRMDWNQVEVIVNGCFVSEDMWVLKVIGMSTAPAQVFFGVHPKKGISWYYKVKLNGVK
jgi:hypothetical protein